ncbi:hypothetical protein [Thermoleptolyngbya sp. C42_A2020_037]|uniref:hypothetical protein n=1 Tax=Thermoleptolyngbya sp. C42_A2020_037 TaxID=2747799 RepID=UPI0019E9B029|nr:hypothetical protein [Thermoleptolyngbya sp. C42_A2020_037]MBF2085306.1 hypothetical protein [Thermoleptolyngbya sp. C42_A2020_037]
MIDLRFALQEVMVELMLPLGLLKLLQLHPAGDRPSSPNTKTSWRSPFISQHQNLLAIALHLLAPVPFGDRPSSPNTETSGRSPSSLSTRTSGRSPFISQHPYLSAIAPRHLSEPRTADPNLPRLKVCILPKHCWDFLA